MTMPRTMFEKIWDAHVVRTEAGQPDLLYIDLHLVHEVTSPQAFEGLRLTGRTVRRPDLTVATMDHNVPTTSRSLPILDQVSKLQMETLAQNCADFGVTLYDLHSKRQGIVHVIGPELGLTQPGMTICCDPCHYRQDRHGGRDRLRGRVYRRCDPRAQHGRPHDSLQHEH